MYPSECGTDHKILSWQLKAYKKKKRYGATELATLILKVSSLLIQAPPKTPFNLSLYIIWSSEPRAQQLSIKVPTPGREGCLSLLVCSIPVCDNHWGIPETGRRGPWLSLYTEKLYHLAQCCRATRWCPVSARYITLDPFHLIPWRWEGSSRRCVIVYAYMSLCLSIKKPWWEWCCPCETFRKCFMKDFRDISSVILFKET